MRLILILILSLSGMIVKGQSYQLDHYVFSSSGQMVDNSLYQVDYTFGEPIDLVVSTHEYTISQGYQQPDFFEITSIVDNQLNFISKIFPNPLNDIVIIELGEMKNELRFELFDVSGRKIIQKDAWHTVSTFTIDMSEVPSGKYLLIISDSVTQEYGAYKLLKH